MPTPNPAKPRCPDGCETLLRNSSTGRVFCAKCGNAPISADDELGEVWDVLHAAGINGAGGMSAAEGVKVLASRRTPEVSENDVDAQLEQDYRLYGASYHTVDDQGRKVRIDPTKLVIHHRHTTAALTVPCHHNWSIDASDLTGNRLGCSHCGATRCAV
jgi:hypothetical protein